MGLSTTARVPVSHVLNDKMHIMYFYCDFEAAARDGDSTGCSPTRL